MIHFDLACNICGSSDFVEFAVRSDGIPVILCSRCGHGVVRYFPDDLESIYSHDYYSRSDDAGIGYEDYSYTAEHSVAWAAALLELLHPSGRVLDIGCANGHLLRKLSRSYERFGIEANPAACEECSASGISILGRDILDPQLRANYSNSFDLISAIAVFEHIADFKGAVESAIHLLKPDGLLIFEVPLISERTPQDAWMRTSLEHIHYPTIGSLQYLFENILRVKLVALPLVIRNFASTCVGIAAKSESAFEAAKERFIHATSAPTKDLNRLEARFRCLFDLIHAANNDPDVLALCQYLLPGDANELLVRRLVDLWIADLARSRDAEARLQNTLHYLKAVEDARDWHANESQRRDRIIATRSRDAENQLQNTLHYLKAVEDARDWHANESQKRDRIIAADAAELRAREQRIGTLDQIVKELRIQLNDREQHIGELRHQLQLLDDLRSACDEARAWKSAVENSWSWRITKPIRMLGRIGNRQAEREGR